MSRSQTEKRPKASRHLWSARDFLGALVCSILIASCQTYNPKTAQHEGQLLQQKLRHDRYSEALVASRNNSAHWRNRPSSDAYVTFQLLESETYLALSNSTAALAILNTLAPASDYLRVRRDLDSAEALIKADQYQKAGIFLERGLHASQALNFKELRIDALNLRGQLLGRKGQFPEADEAYRSALHEAEQLNDSYWRARILNNLGFTRLKRERYDEALPYFEKALAAIEKEDAPRLTSVFLSNLAICYKELGDIDRALTLRMEALTIQESMPPSASLMNSYGEIGRLYDARNDPRQAIEHYRRALSVAERLHLKSDAATWAINLSLAAVELQDWTSAENANRLARESDPSGEDDLGLYESLSSAAIAEGRGHRAEARRQYEEVAGAHSDNVRTKWTAYDELGKLYAAEGDRSRSNRSFETAIALIAGSRSLLLKDDHKITFLSQPIQIYQDYVDALIDQQADSQAMLAADSSRAQTMLGDAPVRISLRDLQLVAASSKSVLLSYWLTPHRCFAWIVTERGFERVLLPETETRIRELVSAYRDEILQSPRDPLTNPNSAGWKLSDAVLRPIEDKIPPGSNVIAVLDGALHDITLETVPVSRTHPQYWLERVTFSVAPSLAALTAKLATPGRAPRGILAIGDADPTAHFPRLPQARAELASIETRFPGLQKTVLTGPDATAERYRAERPEQFSFIHFATHAEANRLTPLDSAVILSPHNGEYKLYARDIAKPSAPLRAELVTISGCTSAGSKSFHGEGSIGLAWAFLHAGARNVVAGLWQADDASTSQLMNRFYANLEAGQKPSESLRAAKLELVRAKRKPYYWGPFQVYRRTAE